MIHLAALQVPFCRADPPLGARVNVLGTVNVFEAAKATRRPARPSSTPRRSPRSTPRTRRTMTGHPGTIYGVYKRANESTAPVYLGENGVSSVGLRPHTVYGVGRDQGLTSAPTTAMLAAAAGAAYTIPYGGAAQLQLAARRRPRLHRREPRGPRGRGRPQPAAAARGRRRRARSSPALERRHDRLRRRRACRSPRRSTAARSPSSCRASPRRRSATASRRPSTASARSSPRASSNRPTQGG